MVEREEGQQVSHHLWQIPKESQTSSPLLRDLLDAGRAQRVGIALVPGKKSRSAARGRCARALVPRHNELSPAEKVPRGRVRRGQSWVKDCRGGFPPGVRAVGTLKNQTQEPRSPSACVPLSQTRKMACRDAFPGPSRPFHLPQILSPSFLVHPWATPHQVSYARK